MLRRCRASRRAVRAEGAGSAGLWGRMGGVWGRAARLGFPAASRAAAPSRGRQRGLCWAAAARPGPLLLVAAAAALPRGWAPPFLRAGAGRGSWCCPAGARSAAELCGERSAAMPAAGPAASPGEPQAPAAAEPLRRGRRRKAKVGEGRREGAGLPARGAPGGHFVPPALRGR